MKKSSPFASENSSLEQKNASRQRVRFYVFFILSIHVVGLSALLLNGCRRQPPEPEPIPAPDQSLFQSELEPPTNLDSALPTNDMAAPEMEPPPNFGGTPTAPTMPVDPAPAPFTPAAPQGQEYTVVAGDSFSKIATKFPGVTARAIQDANPTVQPTRLRIGQKLIIPPPAVTPAPAPSAATQPLMGGEQIYTVKAGDNLTTIASRFNTTVRALRAANDLNTDKIRVGQKLKIPAKAPSAPEPAPTTYDTIPSLTPPGQ